MGGRGERIDVMLSISDVSAVSLSRSRSAHRFTISPNRRFMSTVDFNSFDAHSNVSRSNCLPMRTLSYTSANTLTSLSCATDTNPHASTNFPIMQALCEGRMEVEHPRGSQCFEKNKSSQR